MRDRRALPALFYGFFFLSGCCEWEWPGAEGRGVGGGVAGQRLWNGSIEKINEGSH